MRDRRRASPRPRNPAPPGADARLAAPESAVALLARLERDGVTARLGRGGTLVLRGASRLSAALRAEVEREKRALVEVLVLRERWARLTTDRERR